MKYWQYKTLSDYNFIQPKVLEDLGLEGWEMCGCHVTRETEVVTYFKRPIDADLASEMLLARSLKTKF